MTNYEIATIIPARNEEKIIGKTLDSLIDQDIGKFNRIIVVNDGSEDKTYEIVKSYDRIEIVNLLNRGYNAQGTPILANVINEGLKKLCDTTIPFIMILGSDHILPENYISKIMEYMNEIKNVVICSGQINGERSVIPRGSGRIIKTAFWKKIGLSYPLNYGFETYLILKAQQLGYSVKVIDNLVSTTSRPTRTSYKKETYISYGKSLKALGYSSIYSMARIGLLSLRNPKGGLYMFKGYRNDDVQLYEPDLRKFLRSIQHKRISSILNLTRLYKNPLK
ncbi:MAG: glycosyltransferase [Nitrososphaeraceae archaeon]